MARIPFEVEVIFQPPGQRVVVLARRLEEMKFVLGAEPRLGGLRISRKLTQPVALAPDGTTRSDLFAFALSDAADSRRLSVGQRVMLDP